MTMTLDKAIELLKDIGPYRATVSEDDIDAIELGIAALKRELSWRRVGIDIKPQLLPGETED